MKKITRLRLNTCQRVVDVVLGAFEGAGYGRQAFYDSPDMFAGEITNEEAEELKKFFMGDM